MADVDFWEKPGCINNARQKRLLREAGHNLRVHDLLTVPWNAERLRPFFAGLPVAEWFNRGAPAVKSGRVRPDALDEAEALRLMARDPLLIRRPLMQVGNERRAGFDASAVDRWVGLTPGAVSGRSDLESCPRDHQASGANGDCS
jgi:nitrogenase-associated protein